MTWRSFHTVRANLPVIPEDEGTTTAEDETTTPSRTDIDEENYGIASTERIWPGITEDETTTTQPPEAPTTTAVPAAAPNNVTYHFQGDYETVEAHKVNNMRGRELRGCNNICTVAHLIVSRFPEAIQLPGNNTAGQDIDGDQRQQQQLEKESISAHLVFVPCESRPLC